MAPLSKTSVRLRVAVRIAVPLAIVAATLLAVGAGPFVRGFASVSAPTILIAFALVGVATAAAAWRWREIAHGLGIRLTWRAAFFAYYRSQFLNTVLPGGILGDVHRAYDHGRQAGNVRTAARAVATERVLGQFVQIALALAVLVPLGMTSALGGLALASAVLSAVAVTAVCLATLTTPGRRVLRRELQLLSPLLSRPRTIATVVISSIVVTGSFCALFIVAGLAAGATAVPGNLGAVALVVLGASAIPVNVGGWGPREAASASAFALIGLGASTGLTVSAAFGMLAMIAVAPGALVLVGDRIRAHGGRTRSGENAGERAVVGDSRPPLDASLSVRQGEAL